jgi:Tetratricopeptide repeat
LLMRALAIKERLHGPDHPDVALTVHNLGLLYVTQGFPEKAEPLYRRVLAIREKALGETHRDVEKSLDDLVGLLKKLHREADAAPFEARLSALKQRRS